MSDDGAQVGLGTGGNVVWGASIEHPASLLVSGIFCCTVEAIILRLPQSISLAGALGLEKVTVLSGLLKDGGMNGIALLENLLGGGILVHQAGDEGLRTGILAGLADAVEEVGGGDGANDDVEAALLSLGTGVSEELHSIGDHSELSELVKSSWSASGGGAYAETLVDGLGVGGVGAKPARWLAQQLPRGSSTATGGKHGWMGRIDKKRVVMTL